MKTVLCTIVYLIFLFPAVLAALDKWDDLVDPGIYPVPPSFWLTGVGQCLLFAAPLAAAALALYVFLFVLKRLWRFAPA